MIAMSKNSLNYFTFATVAQQDAAVVPSQQALYG